MVGIPELQTGSGGLTLGFLPPPLFLGWGIFALFEMSIQKLTSDELQNLRSELEKSWAEEEDEEIAEQLLQDLEEVLLELSSRKRIKELRDFRIIVSGNPYTAPEFRRFHVQGTLCGVPDDEPACLTSSPIVSFSGNRVITRSGSTYLLLGDSKLVFDGDLPSTKEVVFTSMEEATRLHPYIELK